MPLERRAGTPAVHSRRRGEQLWIPDSCFHASTPFGGDLSPQNLELYQPSLPAWPVHAQTIDRREYAIHCGYLRPSPFLITSSCFKAQKTTNSEGLAAWS